MHCIPFSVKKWNPIECSGFHAAWLNAVDFMKHAPKHPDWMQWIPCSVIECSVIHAAWLNASRLNAVYSIQRDWMQCIPCSVKKRYTIECSEYYAAWLNAVDSMQHDWCSGFYTAWPKVFRLNAVDSMQRNWMQKIQCILAKWIPIVCSGVYAARQNASDWMQWILSSMAQNIPIEFSGFPAAWLNAVYSMQRGKMHPHWMQWFPCSVIECSVFHAAWRNGTQLNARIYAALLNAVDSKSKIECSGFYAAWPKASRLNAVDSMHCDWMQWTACNVVKCIPIECSGFHAAWLSAVNSIQLSKMNPD